MIHSAWLSRRRILSTMFLATMGALMLSVLGLVLAGAIATEISLHGSSSHDHFEFWRLLIVMVAAMLLAYLLLRASAAMEEDDRQTRAQLLGGVFVGSIMFFLVTEFAKDQITQCFGNEFCNLPIGMSMTLFQATTGLTALLVFVSLIYFAVAFVDFLVHPPPAFN
jgi:hypothetical protein